MSRSSFVSVACLFVSALALAACQAEVSEPVASTGNVVASSPEALSLVGRYAFDLRASDVFARVTESCKKDAAKEALCLDEALSEARREGIAFESRDGALSYVSFGDEGEFLRVPVAMKREGGAGTRFSFTVTGEARGPHVSMFRKTRVPTLEVVDERTVAILDPSKGRLVFRRP